jgi:Icc-related predicted phosphoesterase
MRLVLLSDTHGLHRQVNVPAGDVLVFAGDATRKGDLAELADFDDWLAGLPHPEKIIIAGNRDFCFESQQAEALQILRHAKYIQDETISLDGYRLYGSPWQPVFLNMAFNLERGESLRKKWALIPPDTDILVTHTPPSGFGDRTNAGMTVGDRDLTEATARIQPKLHVFGHIHEGYGKYPTDSTLFINASVVDGKFQPTNAPWVIDIP